MTDSIAILTIQQVVRVSAHNARPDAPARPGSAPIAQRAGVIAARQRVSAMLHHVAEVVHPVGSGMTSPLPASR